MEIMCNLYEVSFISFVFFVYNLIMLYYAFMSICAVKRF